MIICLLTFLILLVTLLPLTGKRDWWVKGWEFPRLQLGVLIAVILCSSFFWAGYDPLTFLCWVLLASALLYQLKWILPYSVLHKKEVPSSTGSSGIGFSILSANVLTPNRDAEKFIDFILEYEPTVFVTLESDKWWETQIESQLGEEYPYAIKCPLDNFYGIHLYSRLPIEDGEILYLVEPDKPSIHAKVRLLTNELIQLHLIHPAPPSPSENQSSIERDIELALVGLQAAENNIPTVVAGDLNDVAWSRTTREFTKVSQLLDPRVGRGLYNTFHAEKFYMRWPLDHVFHSKQFKLVELKRLGYFGSDHFPMYAHLQLTR